MLVDVQVIWMSDRGNVKPYPVEQLFKLLKGVSPQANGGAFFIRIGYVEVKAGVGMAFGVNRL
ncbi:hypothetical protein AB9P05_24325 [Roseivirga sp. BDSF3-8]|uniref:hypothetical protein n=1 Tax=Roseivirga sp. BDSF3-8 TaxID=3241598 RepID=UPI0035324B00